MQPECGWCPARGAYACKACLSLCCADHSKELAGRVALFRFCFKCSPAVIDLQCGIVDDFVQGIAK